MDVNENFIIEKSSDGYIPKIFLDATKVNVRDLVTSDCDKSITPTQIET